MQRFASILLLATFLMLGSGTLSHWHTLAHEREDAAATEAGQPIDSHSHDETNCDLHAKLRAPIASTGWVPILVLLGLFVAFLTERAPALVGQRIPSRLICRGPPAM